MRENQVKMDVQLLLVVITLLLFGLLTIYSSSSFQAIRSKGNSLFYLVNQIGPLFIGGLLALIASKINYRVWDKLAPFILLIAILLLVYVLIFSKPINNVQRWIRINGISIQPGEVAKIAIIIWLSSYLSRNKAKVKDLKGFAPIITVSFIVLGLLVLEPSFGVAFTVCLSILFLMFVGEVKIKHMIFFLGAVSSILLVGISKTSYAKARFSTFLSGEVYQVTQSMQGIGAGGIFGVGLGQGKEKLLFLPYPHTDFIFSSLAEELGMVGSIVVFLLFAIFFLRGIRIATHVSNTFGSLLAFGITFNIFISALLHIGVASGILPATGLPLPFISYGGSSLVVNLVSVGILLNISKKLTKDSMA